MLGFVVIGFGANGVESFTLPTSRKKYDFDKEARKRGLQLTCWGLFDVRTAAPVRKAPKKVLDFVAENGIPIPDYPDNVDHYVVAYFPGYFMCLGCEQEAHFYGAEVFCFVDRLTNEPVTPEASPVTAVAFADWLKKLVAEGSIVLAPPPPKMSSMERDDIFDAAELNEQAGEAEDWDRQPPRHPLDELWDAEVPSDPKQMEWLERVQSAVGANAGRQETAAGGAALPLAPVAPVTNPTPAEVAARRGLPKLRT